MAKILVVDDEKIISSSLARILKRAEHEVEIANNGVEAAQKVDSGFDLVIMDLLMPEVGGAEVLDLFKKRSPSTKMIMMTAYGDHSVKDDLLSRGASLVLAKPFDDITKIPDLVMKALAN